MAELQRFIAAAHECNLSFAGRRECTNASMFSAFSKRNGERGDGEAADDRWDKERGNLRTIVIVLLNAYI